MLENFRSLRKFFLPIDDHRCAIREKTISHEGREGHEDRITERLSNLEKILFFLRALRVLRGDIRFSFGCGSAAVGNTRL
jgi:hypothetical protein